MIANECRKSNVIIKEVSDPAKRLGMTRHILGRNHVHVKIPIGLWLVFVNTYCLKKEVLFIDDVYQHYNRKFPCSKMQFTKNEINGHNPLVQPASHKNSGSNN